MEIHFVFIKCYNYENYLCCDVHTILNFKGRQSMYSRIHKDVIIKDLINKVE